MYRSQPHTLLSTHFIFDVPDFKILQAPFIRNDKTVLSLDKLTCKY